MDNLKATMDQGNDETFSRWIPATLNQQRGHVATSSNHLWFAVDGSVNQKWPWNICRCATASFPRGTESPWRGDEVLLITSSIPGVVQLVFCQFEDRETFLAVQRDFDLRISQARAATNHTYDQQPPAQPTPEPQQAVRSTTIMDSSFNTQNSDSSASLQIELAQMRSIVKKMELQMEMQRKEAEKQQKETAKQQKELEYKIEELEYMQRHANQQEARVLIGQPPMQKGMLEEDPTSPFGDLDPFLEKNQTTQRGTGTPTGPQTDLFGESTYTLLFLFSSTSQSFWYGIFIISLQLSTTFITLWDVVDLDSDNNIFGVPAMVEWTVTFAQAILVFMILAFVPDAIEAVLKLQNGYFPEVLEKHPGATFSTWLLSCIIQLSSGLLLLAGCVILIMQSETVVDLMLNVTALLFIAEIDDIGFAMGKMGFVTNRVQREALTVADFRMPQRPAKNRIQRILYLLSLATLLTGYAMIKNWQMDGEYLATHVYVQFGDAYNPKIPYYSGIYISDTKRATDRRKYHGNATHDSVVLGYCHEEKLWTFSTTGNPCEYFARTKGTTDTFDVTSIPDSEWQVMDSDNRTQPFDSFKLLGRDCDPKTCSPCSSDNFCHCSQDQFGTNCEFSIENVCDVLKIDERFSPFPTVKIDGYGLSRVSNSFSILKDPTTNAAVKVYDMPVYYAQDNFPAKILFFGGRRWIMTNEKDLLNLPEGEYGFFPQNSVEKLTGNDHPYSNYTPLLMSDPVDFGTPKFRPTPIGLGWWLVKDMNKAERLHAPDAPVETVLKCKPVSCHGQEQGFCQNDSTCDNTTGTCLCRDDYYGDLCEFEKSCHDQPNPCGGNGVCDERTGHCNCNPPYWGKLCNQRHSCKEGNEEGKCQNGGECNKVTGNCDCPSDPAIHGEACELIATCFVFGCENGGYCSSNGKCMCRRPFYGTLCSFIDTTQDDFFCTSDDDCTNGTCNLDTRVCKCLDEAAYGTLCEHKYDCSEQTRQSGEAPMCQNSGNCTESTGVCTCPKGYSGPDCSQVDPCLNSTDCSGEVCNVTSGRCECSLGPSAGKKCENKESWCSTYSEECRNRWSSCNADQCTCLEPFGGSKCGSLLVHSTLGNVSTAASVNCGGSIAASCDICYMEGWGECGGDCTYLHPLGCINKDASELLEKSIHKEEEAIELCGFDDPLCFNYNGTLNTNADGTPCGPWNETYWVEIYPDSGLESNYCRNPRGHFDTQDLWCVTNSSSELVICNMSEALNGIPATSP